MANAFGQFSESSAASNSASPLISWGVKVEKEFDFDKATSAMLDAAKDYLKSKLSAIRKTAQGNLKEGDGARTFALKNSLKNKIKTKPGKIWAAVGVDANYVLLTQTESGKTIRHRPVKYAHLVEGGFEHYPDGKKIAARPFLQKAVLSNGGENGIAAGLNKVLKESAGAI